MASISITSMASEESRSGARQRVVLAATIGNTLEWYDFLTKAPDASDNRCRVVARNGPPAMSAVWSLSGESGHGG
jgi:hypothetical protein